MGQEPNSFCGDGWRKGRDNKKDKGFADINKGYAKNSTSQTPLDENAICYFSCWNGKEIINIGRNYFNTLDSGYFVDVLSCKKPSDELFGRLNHTEIVGSPASFNWGRIKIGGE
jgi:hypothetical protein